MAKQSSVRRQHIHKMQMQEINRKREEVGETMADNTEWKNSGAFLFWHPEQKSTPSPHTDLFDKGKSGN